MSQEAAHILIIDDEQVALNNLQHILNKEGHRVTTANSGPEGMRLLQSGAYDLVLTDLRMPEVVGMDILRYSRAHHPQTPVIMITGHATIDTAVAAMRAGAFHYLTKPFRLDEVRQLVAEALELHNLRRENQRLREMISIGAEQQRFLTQDPATQKILETAQLIARSESNVIITGESGTGKELLARLIHEHSGRSGKPFVAVNCGALSEELLTNELFGHSKGAYTGATEARAGLIESANGGTLFLDEFTEMSPSMQVKLLRVIQEGEIQRLGETRPVKVNVRYLAASNRDLQEAVASGTLRQDLYFRLNVVHLHLPPLRQRPGDIPLLAHYFLKKHSVHMGKLVEEISARAVANLNRHDFPGNVRELSNLIERGVALCDGHRLDLEHLPPGLQKYQATALNVDLDELPTLEQQERDYISWVLAQTEGNRTRSAEILGIDRVSLWRKIKKYELE
jgi:DNA-binding NtrC family response regulator